MTGKSLQNGVFNAGMDLSPVLPKWEGNLMRDGYVNFREAKLVVKRLHNKVSSMR